MKKIFAYLTAVCLVVTLLAGCTLPFYEKPGGHTFLQSRENVVKVEICTNSAPDDHWPEGREMDALRPLVELTAEEIDSLWNELSAFSAYDTSADPDERRYFGDLLFVFTYAVGQQELVGFYDIGVLNPDGTFAGYRDYELADRELVAKIFSQYARVRLLTEESIEFGRYHSAYYENYDKRHNDSDKEQSNSLWSWLIS